MKERLLSNWSLVRVIYLVIGILVIIQSIFEKEWVGTALGAYVAAMGLFAFGCAGGQCFSGNCMAGSKQQSSSKITPEEIKGR